VLRSRSATDADREGEYRQISCNTPGFLEERGLPEEKKAQRPGRGFTETGGFWLAKTFGIAAAACGVSLEYEVVVSLNEIEASADLTDAAAKWSQRPTR
jgi:hypothetical protein